MHPIAATGHRDHRGTYELCGPQANLGGPSRFKHRSFWSVRALRRNGSSFGPEFPSFPESDFKNSGALRPAAACPSDAVSRVAICHSDRLGCKSALEGISDPSQTLREVRNVPQPDIGAYSITSSASASRLGGISRSSAFAVLRLIAISNFTGAWAGRSAGLVPFRMRSM